MYITISCVFMLLYLIQKLVSWLCSCCYDNEKSKTNVYRPTIKKEHTEIQSCKLIMSMFILLFNGIWNVITLYKI